MENELRIALRLMLDCVDYTAGNCRVNEMVGAVLPREIIERAKKLLSAPSPTSEARDEQS
jgi:hypothetical protein